MQKVALLCAIPQERRPILRRLCNPSRSQVNEIPIWNCTLPNLHVTLAETGVGTVRAANAARNIIRLTAPDIVISTGFCGAVKPGLRRGDIVLAERILTYSTALQPSTVSLDRTLLDILGSPGKIMYNAGTFITTQEMVAKHRIAALLGDQYPNPVLEMESHAVAEVCSSSGIPFAAIRAISDTADQDPQPVCSKVFSEDMEISMLKLIKAVVTAPQTTRELLRLYIDTETAGRSLAEAVEFSLERL